MNFSAFLGSVTPTPDDPKTRLSQMLEDMWGLVEDPRRGPRRSLTLDQIASAAIEIADSDGIEGVSMRSVAAALEVGTMSLYRYTRSKVELLDLMVDHVHAEVAQPTNHRLGWRKRLTAVAEGNRRMYEQHPWMLRVDEHKPRMGPGTVRKYERELEAVEGIGLPDQEMDRALRLILGYVRSASAGFMTWGTNNATSGELTSEEWWDAVLPILERIPLNDYPIATRVGTAVSEALSGKLADEEAFDFGLQRILDGIDALVAKPSTTPRST